MEQKDLNNPPTTSTLSGKKRARSENWVEEDKILLRELVKERVHALENKNTDTNTNAKKLNAWADLMLSFNSMCKGSPRKLAQLKTQWTGQKMDEKKKKGNVRREMLKTGGGPPPPSEQCDPDDIESWLPHEFTVDTCEGDSDFLHQYETVHVNILDEHAITTTDAIEEVPLATSAPTEAVEIVAAASTPLKKRKKIIKKQKNNDDAAGLPATLIANNEIKCRQELHAKQMKNEDLKYEVLLLGKELLKHKIEFYKSKTNK